MVARVVERWGRVDVLVANAGGGRGRPMDTKASNLDPALLQLVVPAVAPTMKGQRSVKIITVVSIAETAASRLCTLWVIESGNRPLHGYLARYLGAVWDHGELRVHDDPLG